MSNLKRAPRVILAMGALVLAALAVTLWGFIPVMAAIGASAGLGAFGLGTVVADITELSTPDAHKVRDVSVELTYLRPDYYAIDTILRRMESKNGMAKAKQVKVEWKEDDVIPRADLVNGVTTAGPAGGPKVITVDNGAYWRKDDLIYIPDNVTSPGAVLWVSNVTGNNLTVYLVTAGGTTFGTVPALADNEAIKRIGNAKEQGGNASDSRATMPVDLYNYTQIFDAVLAIDGTRKATQNYTINDYTRNEKQVLYDLRRSATNSAIFGKRALINDPTTGKQRSFMGGILSFLSTNDISYTAGSLTESNLIDLCKQMGSGNAGSRERLFFTTPSLTAEIDKVLLASGTLQSSRNEKVLGVSATRIHSTFLDLLVINQQELAELGKLNWGLIVDPAYVRRRPLRPMTKKDIADKDVDGDAEQWLEEVSMEVRYEKVHGVFRNTATDSFA